MDTDKRTYQASLTYDNATVPTTVPCVVKGCRPLDEELVSMLSQGVLPISFTWYTLSCLTTYPDSAHAGQLMLGSLAGLPHLERCPYAFCIS